MRTVATAGTAAMTEHVRILGTGHALPSTGRTTEAIEALLGHAPDELFAATGVANRFVCEAEDQISLAIEAAAAALDQAGLAADAIDLVISASGIPFQTLPTTAPLIMAGLGIGSGQAAAFDVNATCLSFLTGLDMAAARLTLGASDAALVVSSEVASRALPWTTQPEVAALFGDGAAAAVLVRDNTQSAGIVTSKMETYPCAYDACSIAAGGTKIDFHTEPDRFAENAIFAMDGPALFRVTHRHFPGFVQRVLDGADWRMEDVDLVVPHQASPLALAHMVQTIGFPSDRVVNIAECYGNQIAASIPTSLDIARRQMGAGPGARVLMLGTSAGVSFGGTAMVL